MFLIQDIGSRLSSLVSFLRFILQRGPHQLITEKQRKNDKKKAKRVQEKHIQFIETLSWNSCGVNFQETPSSLLLFDTHIVIENRSCYEKCKYQFKETFSWKFLWCFHSSFDAFLNPFSTLVILFLEFMVFEY